MEKGKGVIITISVSPEDADELVKAFKDGAFEDLGATEIKKVENKNNTRQSPEHDTPDLSGGQT